MTPLGVHLRESERADTLAPRCAALCGTQAQAVQFAKQTGRWVSMVHEFDKSLKARRPRSRAPMRLLCKRLILRVAAAAQEVGDFENWVKVMEWDMQAVATALEVAADATSGSAGGGGAGAGGAAQRQ